MVEKSFVEHELFVCSCDSPDHQIIVTRITSDEYEDKDLYVSVGLIENVSFFRRILIALKYIFKCNNDTLVTVILDPQNQEKLKNIL